MLIMHRANTSGFYIRWKMQPPLKQEFFSNNWNLKKNVRYLCYVIANMRPYLNADSVFDQRRTLHEINS